jgi:Galactosyltransferase.
LKTYSFFQIIYAIVQEYHVPVTRLFKTDDDSYVNLHALVQELQESSLQQNSPSSSSSSSLPMVDGRHDYFGQCQFKYPKVHRESDYKWPITNETYPEPWFPRYCQGAGFGISLHFLTCAAGRGHISNIRFMPFEDVAVGMLAERCGVDPQRPVTAKVKVFRYQSDEVKKRTRLGDTRTDDLVPPAACMMNKIVQHRIIDEYDMEEHHETVLDPLYCNVTRVKRDQLIQQMKEKGIEWFG